VKSPGRAIAVVSLTIAAAIPLLQFALLFPMTLGIPSWDQWSEIEVWAAHYEHRPVLPLLLKPYNGHYNVLPALIISLTRRSAPFMNRNDVLELNPHSAPSPPGVVVFCRIWHLCRKRACGAHQRMCILPVGQQEKARRHLRAQRELPARSSPETTAMARPENFQRLWAVR